MASNEMNEHLKSIALAQTNLFQAIKACPITQEKEKEAEQEEQSYNFKMQRESVLSEYDASQRNTQSVVGEFNKKLDSPQPNAYVPVKKDPNNFGMFKDSVVLFNKNSRKQLPHLVLDEPVAFWKIIKNVIG